MFFPIGWPRVLNPTNAENITAIVCNRDKILFAILTNDALALWYCKVSTINLQPFIFFFHFKTLNVIKYFSHVCQ